MAEGLSILIYVVFAEFNDAHLDGWDKPFKFNMISGDEGMLMILE